MPIRHGSGLCRSFRATIARETTEACRRAYFRTLAAWLTSSYVHIQNTYITHIRMSFCRTRLGFCLSRCLASSLLMYDLVRAGDCGCLVSHVAIIVFGLWSCAIGAQFSLCGPCHECELSSFDPARHRPPSC